MLPHVSAEVARLRRQDALAVAQARRRAALAPRSPWPDRIGLLLVRLGRRLERAGKRLQRPAVATSR